MNNLYSQWLEAKSAEAAAVQKRREIEDQLISGLAIEQTEGTKTIKADGFKVKVTQRFNRSVNSDLLQEIAAENGLSHHLSALFRWKPEINAKAWQSATPDITEPLRAAITTNLGRPSFSISIEKTEG